MLISQQHYGYNRFRAMQPRPLRQLMDFVHGVPDGHRTAGETGSEAVQAALLRGQSLANQGFPTDPEIMVWGSDPLETIKIRAAQGMYLGPGVTLDAKGEPDPASWKPAPDMSAIGPKPFSPWGYRPDPNINTDSDNIEMNGVGFLYPSLPGDSLDVGARYSGEGKGYEKVAWNGPYGHVIKAWERIA